MTDSILPLFVGFCTIDRIDNKEYLGGAAGASAINAAQLGYKTTLISVLSKDKRGSTYRKKLSSLHVNTSYCITHRRSLPTCDITNVFGQGSTRVWNDNGALLALEQTHLTLPPEDSYNAVFLYSCHPAFQMLIHSSTTPLIFIPGPQILTKPFNLITKTLTKTLVLCINNEESAAISPESACSYGTEIVILTKGKEGGIIYSRHQKPAFFQPPKTHVVDTTGAGDSFALGFGLTYLQTKSIPKALNAGLTLTSRVLQNKGSTLHDII